jgi:superfamily II DNA or RNA helicase
MNLRKYQSKAIEDIHASLNDFDKVLFQLPTGGGKTFIFTQLIKTQPNKRYLILVNRAELVEQTINSLQKSGITAEKITAKTKELYHHAQCYVAMEATLVNRLKKNPLFIRKIDLCIIDECHQAHFDKFVTKFEKVLGFTATPVRLERKKYFVCDICSTTHEENTTCCDTETMEWTRPLAMSEIYETIVLGPTITELIEGEFLMPEIVYVQSYADSSKLKEKNGEFTESSITDAYGTNEALFNVVKNYNAYCKEKKTMVFNGSTASNLAVYNRFISEDVANVRLYDSINTTSDDRTELVNWFKKTDGAVLCNVGVFTTGFDVTDVEAIIVNRPTQSLSLWLQIVGRGARFCFHKFKDKFIVIDGGENVERHGEWSSKSRDWVKIFEDGIGKKKPKKMSLEEVKECPECFLLMPKRTSECPECDYQFQKKSRKSKEIIEGQNVNRALKKPPYPNGKKIIKYCETHNMSQGDAFKILYNQMLDLFVLNAVTLDAYLSSKKSGELQSKLRKYFFPVYFEIIKSNLPSSGNKTIANTETKILTKIEKYYGIS